MKSDNIFGVVGSGITWIATFVQTNETLQIISVICAVLASLSTIIYNIIKGVNNAKKDGKITAEEVEGIVKTASEDLTDLANQVKGDKKEND